MRMSRGAVHLSETKVNRLQYASPANPNTNCLPRQPHSHQEVDACIAKRAAAECSKLHGREVCQLGSAATHWSACRLLQRIFIAFKHSCVRACAATHPGQKSRTGSGAPQPPCSACRRSSCPGIPLQAGTQSTASKQAGDWAQRATNEAQRDGCGVTVAVAACMVMCQKLQSHSWQGLGL